MQQGMEQLFNAPELRKICQYFFGRYPHLETFATWEDLLHETLIRFVDAVQQGRKPERNCWGFLRNICRNICQEATRSNQHFNQFLAWLQRDDNSKAFPLNAKLIAKLLGRLSLQCRLLLEAKFFRQPPLHGHAELSALLLDHGIAIKASAISATITRCKGNFRAWLLENFDDLFAEE